MYVCGRVHGRAAREGLCQARRDKRRCETRDVDRHDETRTIEPHNGDLPCAFSQARYECLRRAANHGPHAFAFGRVRSQACQTFSAQQLVATSTADRKFIHRDDPTIARATANVAGSIEPAQHSDAACRAEQKAVWAHKASISW